MEGALGPLGLTATGKVAQEETIKPRGFFPAKHLDVDLRRRKVHLPSFRPSRCLCLASDVHPLSFSPTVREITFFGPSIFPH